MANIKYTDFTDDEEKMKDFHLLSKERFLESYSYLTEEEYDLTLKKLMTWHHPKYYKELAKQRKEFLKQQAASDKRQASSSKQQATSSEDTSDKRQAPSYKRQDT